MTGATANNLDFSGSAGANLPNAFLGNWAGNGAKAEFSGIITPASDNYRLGAKGSSGLLGIVGTNKLTGSQGLIVGGTGGSGIRVELAAAQNFTGETVITTGAKLTLGNNLALQNSALNLGSAGGTFALSTGTNAGRISGDVAAPSPTFGGLKGSRNLYAAFTSAGGNNESLLVNTAVIGFTLNVGTGLTHTYSGAIGGFGTGASGGLNGASTLTKTGAGTQILTGTSTYNGVTTITGGTLSIDGAGSINNSDVTVDGGTFRYNSSVAYSKTLTFTSGAVAGTNLTGSLGGITIGSGQTLSPGNSPGTAETTSQTWAGGGSYLWEINNATGTAGADPGWDLLTGTGTLDITASAATPFNILVTSLTLANVGGDAANFNPLSSYNWMIADFVDPVTGFAADAFNVNATGFTNPGATGSFSVVRGDAVGGDDTQVYLTYVPVPEPSATVLLGLGALALLRRRRRR
jgi:autotransporter-associated beta strand protein